MSENLQKFIGIAVMALIVVVGVVATNNDDSDFDRTRNAAFAKGGVMAKEAQPAKGGDCCDEALYRIAQMEERIARLEGYEVAREELRQRTPAEEVNRIIEQQCLLSERLTYIGLQVYTSCVAETVVGISLEDARLVVETKGLGFRHRMADGSFDGVGVNGRDGRIFCGTLATGSGQMNAVSVDTTQGVVTRARWELCPN